MKEGAIGDNNRDDNGGDNGGDNNGNGGDNGGDNNGNGDNGNGTPGKNGIQSQLNGSITKMIDRIFNKSTNTYNYCLGGNVTCPSGNLVSITDSYTGGTTYNYLCSNNTEPICANNYFIESDASNSDGYLDYEVGGIDFVFNTQDGFSSPYNTPDAPFVYDQSLNMIEFYHDGLYNDNVDICKFLGSESRTKNCM
jgi:hypothetical protein